MKTTLITWLICLVPVAAAAGIFDIPELQVAPSPLQACFIQLKDVEKVVDYDVSPAGPLVAALVKGKDGAGKVVFWQIGEQETSVAWNAPSGFMPRSIAWHPRAQSLFVSGAHESEFCAMRLDKQATGWADRIIFKSPNQLRRLVVGPSPFAAGSYGPETGKESLFYRLFLGMKNEDGTYRIVSITEEGKRFYQVIGPAATVNRPKASRLEAVSALPLAFHPAGHQLIWEDGRHKFHFANYHYQQWGKSKPLLRGALTGGSVTPTPNGLGLVHWQPSSPGIGLFLLPTNKEERQAASYRFVATPSSVPDGRGIVGLTKFGDRNALNYIPISVPLADVVNAWMFCESANDLRVLDEDGGLFRPVGQEQLYQLYESELYYCGGYSNMVPTRPYLVTTDIFWELFAAAYEGLFIVKERELAMPAFWKFVSAADQYYKESTRQSHWRPVFRAVADLRSGDTRNPETARIRTAREKQYSETLKIEVDYADLKPRGHYTSSSLMQDYFRAIRYLTSVYSNDPEIMNELKMLPPDVKRSALAWIGCYQGLISPSRAPLVWKDGNADQLAYNRYPDRTPALFPLSWGFDNEVLLRTVYHQDWPVAERVAGPQGLRLIPSGLDVAAALGSRFAESLLETEYNKYPNLRQVIQNLKKSYEATVQASSESTNLYERWLNALAVQWADDLAPPDGGRGVDVWRAKRLQTGLASWATLRHATVLVNERTAAECGEGGFEEIVLRAPRGYVEPDPRTFGAIAGLFETAIHHVDRDILKTPGNLGEYSKGLESLRRGIIRRFTESAAKARQFQAMAEKELRGDVLTSQEYDEILHVARVAEHHFLVYKSLANELYGLSTPDPIPKIADVAGGGKFNIPLLMAAVGRPLEWNHVVPYFGRHQVVKGCVYSYYEFVSKRALSDKDWRGMVESQQRPAWIEPFVVKEKLLGRPESRYTDVRSNQ